ncbi:AUGMIN subunit [Sesamum alatum]|uniref:ubiquitinyl hydrolase 1 n=1 Tax=Sesamum alatum TaxID=300844 RepID=A0AAE2CF24_9LAMI|nr:AUGMIN subunit [Sesamum alatum]
MSGARLCGLLAELGYEGHGSLDPDSFEWPFQYDDVRPILDWLCSSLRPSNVLSPSELSQYEQFLQEGKLLEGEDLDFAYDSISAFSARRDNQEAVFGTEEGLKEIRDATLAAKAEALELQKQLRHLQFQNDMLTGQASALIQGRRARVAATSTANGQLTTIDDSLSARNLEMNAVLGRMASTAQELAHYHSGDEDGIYLAYADFHPYLLADAVCMKELNQWFLKQLDTGPYRLVAEEGKSKCSWVSLNEISNVMVQDTENTQQQRLSELQRLRSIFGTSERQWVEAQVENAKQQAQLMTLKAQVTSDEAHIHLDLHSLRRKHAELAGELSTLYRKEEKLLSETIPDLCWELAQLQDTYILQGDYDLKVMRQEFYINRQKAFINHLINQLSRHQFLKLACQLERKTMLGAYSLLKVIELELQGYLSAGKGRVGRCMALVQAASDVPEQGAVDDRDTFLHGVRDLLSIYSNAQAGLSTYVSVPGIVQQLSNLHSDLRALQSDLEYSLPEDRNRSINELCTLVQSLQQLLFASSTTAQPILTPWTLMKELDEMEKVNAKLSAAVEDVTLEHCKKNEIVKHHSQEMALQRRVFVDFFCNPERLRNQVKELTARVRALQAPSPPRLYLRPRLGCVMDNERKLIYHEKQRLQFCLLHSLNNLFQEKDTFTRAHLNVIAEKLHLEDPDKSAWTPLSVIFKPHHNALTGNYDINVLIAALEERGKSVIWHDRRCGASSIDLDGPEDKLFGIVLNVPVRRYGGLWRSRHWIALRRVERVWYNLDSDLSAPYPFKNTEEIREFLDGVISIGGEVLLVTNGEG